MQTPTVFYVDTRLIHIPFKLRVTKKYYNHSVGNTSVVLNLDYAACITYMAIWVNN